MRIVLASLFAVSLLACSHKAQTAVKGPATTPAAGMPKAAVEDPQCVPYAQALLMLASDKASQETLATMRIGGTPDAEQCAAFAEMHAKRARCDTAAAECKTIPPANGTPEEEAAHAASEIWLHEGCVK